MEITLSEMEGWDRPANNRTEHYFIRIEGSMYGRSLCGKFQDYSFQWFNPHLTAEQQEEIYGYKIVVCPICNELLKKRMRTMRLGDYIK